MSAEVPGVLRYLHRVLDDRSVQGVGDAELVHRFVTRRDESAFELLMWRHAGMVLNVCRAILRDHHLAEDAFQATFLALARKAESIGRRDVVAGWLHRVASNAALKALGRKTRDACEPIITDPIAPDKGDDAYLACLLHEELGRLPEKYRLPLVLCFLEGQSHADAARLLGWPKGTVAGRVARARDLLRSRLMRRAVVLPATLFGTILTAASSSASPMLVSTTLRAAVAFATGGGTSEVVSGSVLRLTEGVVQSMTVSKIKSVALVVCAVSVLAIGGLGFNTWGLAQKPAEGGGGSASAPSPKSKDDAKGGKLRERSLKNLKDIASAADRYLIEKGVFPNNILSTDKKPLLSWRVSILPHLGHKDLYNQFKLDESWDSDHNLKLLSKMPDVFRTGTEAKDSTSTFYQGFADVDSMFPPGEVVRIHDVIDGTANTLLAIEAAEAVTWTKPVDLPYSENRPLPKLGGPFPDVIHAVFVEGTPISIKRNFNEEHMRLAITRADGKAQNGRNLAQDNPPRDPKVPKKEDEEALKKALELVTREREEAIRSYQRAVELQRRVEQERKEAEAQRDELTKARIVAESARKEAVMLKQENDKLKESIREMADQLNKLGLDKKKTEAEQVKDLATQLERTQTELRRLRDEVERLKKAIDK